MLAAETKRQQGFNQEAAQLNDQSQERYVGFVPQQEQRATELADMFASDVGDPNSPTASVMPLSSSDIVNNETTKQMGAAQDYVDQQAGALADLRSFGDLLGSKSLLQARDASKIGQIGGFKQASQAITPYELDNANKAGDGLKLFGDVLRMGGTVLTGAGINGGSLANMFGGNAATAGSWGL
ncbi:hypothetical protein XM25_00570 [Devosia sp. H5989]|nr:hypothetical protein XM25_00570 [Devosia sp. H5989]